ncbi:unnamed protein product [Amoebophrya sp. A120]|nr:unnamed protein product [Amoebophrya sp. A120]|eukprot:GSA120T00004075001.1
MESVTGVFGSIIDSVVGDPDDDVEVEDRIGHQQAPSRQSQSGRLRPRAAGSGGNGSAPAFGAPPPSGGTDRMAPRPKPVSEQSRGASSASAASSYNSSYKPNASSGSSARITAPQGKDLSSAARQSLNAATQNQKRAPPDIRADEATASFNPRQRSSLVGSASGPSISTVAQPAPPRSRASTSSTASATEETIRLIQEKKEAQLKEQKKREWVEQSKWNYGETSHDYYEYSSWNPAYFIPAAAKLTSTTLGTTGIALAYAWGNVQRAVMGHELHDQTTLKGAIAAWFRLNGISITTSWPKHETEENLTECPILVCNHISYVDGMLVTSELDHPKVMAKTELRSLPMIGDFMDGMGTVWVDRQQAGSREAARKAIEDHVKQWRPGHKAMLIFPEGSTTSGHTVGEFKLGAFRPGLPVRPIVLLYFGASDISNPMFKKTSDGKLEEFSDAQWFGNWLGAGFVSALVKVCRIYYPTEEEKQDAELYARNVQLHMKYEYDRLRKKHAEYQKKRKEEMENWGLGWTVPESPEIKHANEVMQGHDFRPFTEEELKRAKGAILARKAKAKQEMSEKIRIANQARNQAGRYYTAGMINSAAAGGGASSTTGPQVDNKSSSPVPFPQPRKGRAGSSSSRGPAPGSLVDRDGFSYRPTESLQSFIGDETEVRKLDEDVGGTTGPKPVDANTTPRLGTSASQNDRKADGTSTRVGPNTNKIKQSERDTGVAAASSSTSPQLNSPSPPMRSSPSVDLFPSRRESLGSQNGEEEEEALFGRMDQNALDGELEAELLAQRERSEANKDGAALREGNSAARAASEARSPPGAKTRHG